MLQPVFFHNLVCDTSKLFSMFQIINDVCHILGMTAAIDYYKWSEHMYPRLGFIEDRITNVGIIVTWR